MQIQEFGKQDRFSSSAADETGVKHSRLFVYDPSTKLNFLIGTGADLSLIPPTPGQRRVDESTDFFLYAANNTKIKTYGKKLHTLDLS